MTREEAYATGFADGCRWAEKDIRSGSRQNNYHPLTLADNDWYRANELGFARGYRDTWARFEAGTLTYEMFESGPL